MLNVIGLSGSLRAASYNTAMLRAAAELLPEGVALTVHDYRDVPLYDADAGTPASVERLRASIAAADAVLIATPEYNHGIPGVLKNALDWASRPAYRSCMAGRPTGMLSAAPGLLGGVRAQIQLRTTLAGMATPTFPHPDVVVAHAGDRIVDGRLVHEATREHLRTYLVGFAAWATRIGRPA